MENRWSENARIAAIAVRRAKALQRGKPVPEMRLPGQRRKPVWNMVKKGSPMVYAGGSANFDERTGKRVVSPRAKLERPLPIKVSDPVSGGGKVPPVNVWVPPPGHPLWNDPKFVESFNKGKGKGTVPPPNIYWDSDHPNGPGQGISGPTQGRVTISGKMYIRSRNGQLVPYRQLKTVSKG